MTDRATTTPIEHLGDLFRIVRRRGPLVVLLTALAAAAAVAVSLNAPAEYEAQSELLIGQDRDLDGLLTGASTSGASDPEREVNTHLELVTVDPVSNAVRRELRLPYDVEALGDKVEVSLKGNSNILLITVRDHDPRRAAAIANAFAAHYVAFEQGSAQSRVEQVTRLVRQKFTTLSRQERRSPEGRQLRARLRELEIASGLQTGSVSIVGRAAPPTTAVAPRPLVAGALAAVLGFVLAVGVALALHFTDGRIRDQADVEALFDVPVLAAVPPPTRRRSGRRPGDDALQHEAYTALATNLRFFDVSKAEDAILLTSPGPQEGKTSVTLGLARALAMLGQRVVAVEADLRRPSFATLLGINAPRAGDGLEGGHYYDRASVEVDAQTLRPVYGPAIDGPPTFTVLPGMAVPNPQALLASGAMAESVAWAKTSSDVVLIDVAPIGDVNDAIVLSHLVAGTILVVRVNRTRKDAALVSLDLLRNAGTQLLGVVLTGARPRRRRRRPSDRRPAEPHVGGASSGSRQLA